MPIQKLRLKNGELVSSGIDVPLITPKLTPNTDTLERCSLLSGSYYRQVVYNELDLTNADTTIDGIEFPCEEDAFGNTIVRTHHLFSEDAHGNLTITPVTLAGAVQQQLVKRSKTSKQGAMKVQTYTITRYAQPDGDHKYDYPSGFISQMPFNPPSLIQAWQKRTPIPTLVLTEGYKKAAKAAKHGLMIQGLPSITIFTDKEADRKGLFPDTVRLIKDCGVKNIIILWDGDCRNISNSDLADGNEITRRPYQFLNMICKLRELLKDYDVDVYFAHIKSDSYEGNPKGLDDLLVTAGDDADTVAADLVLFDGTPKYYHREKITANSYKTKLTAYFGLSDVQAFYTLHHQQIGTDKFMFHKRTWQYQNQRMVDVTDIDVDTVRKTYSIPEGVDIMDYIEFGFYVSDGGYYVIEKGSHVKISNFTMTVKHLIRSVNPKRIIEVRNVFGRVEQIEVSISELISVSKFKEKIEGVGNFSFEGTDRQLGKIKQKLLAQEKQSREFSTLGHQAKENLWAWANGVFLYENNTYLSIDEYGMVTVENDTYYLPYYSSMHQHGDEEFGSMRKVAFERGNDATFERWAAQFYKVYGVNGMMGLAWICSALFRDVIVPVSKSMPMLFAFGQKGSGKGTMVTSLMTLFGVPQEQIMLSGASTTIAFMRKLAQIRNGVVWLDEYANSLDEKKIQSLKNIWDGVGQERGKKSNDTRTEVVPIISSAIISGQDLPTADGGSLFSRVILTEFHKTKGFTDQQIKAYTDLLDMEENGLTAIIHELLSHREYIKDKFRDAYKQQCEYYRAAAMEAGVDVEERQVKNYSIITTLMGMLEIAGIKFPFTNEQLTKELSSRLKTQQSMMQASSELQTFWEMVLIFLQTGKISPGNQIEIDGDRVAIRLVTIMPEYLEAGNRQKLRVLPVATLRSFLSASDEFISTKDYRFQDGGVTKAMLFDRLAINTKYEVWLTCESNESAVPIITMQPRSAVETVPF